jgi:hypothetical protein
VTSDKRPDKTRVGRELVVVKTRVQPADDEHPSILLADEMTDAYITYLICEEVTPPRARGGCQASVTVLLVTESTETAPGLDGNVAFPVTIGAEGAEKAPRPAAVIAATLNETAEFEGSADTYATTFRTVELFGKHVLDKFCEMA